MYTKKNVKRQLCVVCIILVLLGGNTVISQIRLKPIIPAADRSVPGSDDGPYVKEATEKEINKGSGRTGDDVLVAGTIEDEVKPSITSDSAGTLYIAVEYAGASNKDIDIYRSTTDGATWTYWTGITGTSDCMNPSLAVGEGFESWLFLAFNYGENNIYVFRFNLSNPGDYDSTLIQSNALGVSNPRMVTDSSEFPSGWYTYLIYNSGSLAKQELWTLRFTLSLDYGASWETPITLADYSEDDFYDASDAHPDLDYGGHTLYVAFDNFPPTGWGPNRDIFVMSSSDYGSSWSSITQVTTDSKDEYDPVVAAVKDYHEHPTALVAYTYEYTIWDNDIYYTYTQDEGSSWSSNHILVNSVMDEKNPEVTTSYSEGAVHIAYWHDYDVDYARADYTTPWLWTFHPQINDVSTVSSVYTRPSLAVNPTQLVSQEAGICWTDFRNGGAANDIYFDSLLPPANHPPYMPGEPNPFDGETGVDINADLSWVGGDPDVNDSVTYDVYFGTSSPPPQVVWGQLDTTYDPGAMDYNTEYFWKVVAWDNHGNFTEGPVWSFTTEAAVNNPPYDPTEPIPADGSTGVDVDDDLFWCGGDPDPGDTVTYDLYFGTTSPPPQIVWNQSGTSYDPGTMMYGTQYYWRVIAWDNHGASTAGPIWTFYTQPAGSYPDLLVTDIWNVSDQIHYQVRNVGAGNATSPHSTALFVDGMYHINDIVPIMLAPGERWHGVFNYSWSCGSPGDLITVMTDYGNAVVEVNESNNIREELWRCDTTPPDITAGPVILDVGQDYVHVYWETDEQSDSWVFYDIQSGSYTYSQGNGSFVLSHSVILTNLIPSTTYHCRVVSTDITGNTAESDDITFETFPVPDAIDPEVTILDPGIISGPVLLSADASDNTGVAMVEFFLNDHLYFTDYSPPYEAPFDSQRYPNGVFQVTCKAFDLAGGSSQDDLMIDVNNLVDIHDPTVVITAPSAGAQLSGIVQVNATLTDDTGLLASFFRVNGSWRGYEGFPDHPTSIRVSYDWDTTLEENGSYQLQVEVMDIDQPNLRWAVDTVNVTVQQVPPVLPPMLEVDHVVTRYGNYFAVELTVTNKGDSTASNINIEDALRGFQPIAWSLTSPVHATFTTEYDPYYQESTVWITCHESIPAGESRNLIYLAVPVLFYPSSPTPAIGLKTWLHYDPPAGFRIHDTVAVPAAWTWGENDPIPTAYDKALKEADYLIVTSPKRLYMFNSGSQAVTVNNLLSEMAHLARYKQGVLGYIDSYNKYTLQDLVQQGINFLGQQFGWGAWSKKLSDGWTTNGYLLLVGEHEIIPGWDKKIGPYPVVNHGSYYWTPITDYPYASTFGSESKPELNIARIIGNNANMLKIPLETSINVEKGTTGYGFNRSYVFLISGFPSGLGGGAAPIKTKEEVSKVAKVLNNKGVINHVYFHTPDLTVYNPDGSINRVATVQSIKNVFFLLAPQRNIIFFAAHGNEGSCDVINTTQMKQQPDPFGALNPFIFASSCMTGKYAGAYSLAEACLERGAGVYLGATFTGACYEDSVCPYADTVFSKWDNGEAISVAVKQTKQGLGDQIHQRVWNAVYHVFGDAKYGTQGPPAALPIASPQAFDSIQVTIPDFNVTSDNGTDTVTIPGGTSLLDVGCPILPYYHVLVDYPTGCQIQHVVISSQSEPVCGTGLNIPHAYIVCSGCSGTLSGGIPSEPVDWWPLKTYEWTTFDSPSTTTLALSIYPFHYNHLTTDYTFYKNFTFAIQYTQSPLQIQVLTTDKHEYQQGDPVGVALGFSSSDSEPRDIVFSATVQEDVSTEIVSGLFLQTLRNFTGNASYSTSWDSSGFQPGNYHVIVELHDTSGTLLAQRIETFTVGIVSGVITEYVVSQDYFDVGDALDINTTFSNNGSVNITGVAVSTVHNATGYLICEFRHNITGLSPLASLYFSDTWNTAGVDEGCYTISGYVLYGGMTTDVQSILVTTNFPPLLSNEYPPDDSGNQQRPPAELSVDIVDHNSDYLDVSLRWKDHEGLWVTVASYTSVNNGTYGFIPPLTNDWVWGNTTYTWSVNVTDGLSWTNQTYTYTTGGSRYDVSNNNVVNFQDAGLVWVHRTSLVPYDGLFDVNGNGVVNFQDAGLVWVHRD